MNPKILQYQAVTNVPDTFYREVFVPACVAEWKKEYPDRDESQFSSPFPVDDMAYFGDYVQWLIGQGWQPYGFPMYFKDTPAPVQVMVKYADENPG